MPSFIYPRTCSILRAKTVAGTNDAIGDVGYSGEENSTDLADAEGETVLFSNVQCAIQAESPGRPSHMTLPQDATSRPRWKIIIPGAAVPKGAIQDRDIIVDDEGYRYEVAQAYWNVLSTALVTIRLEA